MDLYCTRPGCPRPVNPFPDLDNSHTLKTVQQKFCTSCGMPLILIGRYLPQKLLGRGGFGAAFLARDRYTPTQRQCVVKQFQPAGDLTPDQLQLAQGLFEREGQVLEQLGNAHAQIPDLYAFFPLEVPGLQPGTLKEFFYLVQEFIDGESLEAELEQNGPLEEGEVRAMLAEVLDILQFVHNNGSIHRDIKPSNIVHHRNGRYYLLDFGAVKQVTSVAGPAQSSTGIYSMGYAPPEQMSSSTVYPSTDLYALAVTCITLLTGKSPADLLDPYNNRWDWRPYTQVSAQLATVLDKMLLPTPKQRFQSAADALAALNASPGLPNKPTPQKPSVPQAFSIAPPPAPGPKQAPPPVVTPPPTPIAQTVSQAAPPISPLPPTPAPAAAPTPVKPASRPPRPAVVSRFTTLEVLGGAAFLGFEGSLIAIALLSALNVSPLSLGLAGLGLGGLVLLQFKRLIEGKDLPILVSLTLVLFWFLPILRGELPFTTVVVIAGVLALTAVAITALFRLVYSLLSNVL